jgi:hypothetical protein
MVNGCHSLALRSARIRSIMRYGYAQKEILTRMAASVTRGPTIRVTPKLSVNTSILDRVLCTRRDDTAPRKKSSSSSSSKRNALPKPSVREMTPEAASDSRSRATPGTESAPRESRFKNDSESCEESRLLFYDLLLLWILFDIGPPPTTPDNRFSTRIDDVYHQSSNFESQGGDIS